MSDKAYAQEDPNVTPVKLSKRRKLANHCKRFWWAHLIALICIVVLVVCLVIFVGVPNIAQDKVDDAELDIQGVHVLDSASDSFRMEINSTITTDGSIHAKIDPFEGALYLTDLGKESTFVTLDFPETSAEKHQKVNVSQHENIEDMTTFTQFNSFFIYNKTVSVTVEGKTKAQPRGLNRKYGVNFKKTLEFAGLNKLAGTAVPVQSANLSFTKDEDGNNFRGVAIIPNPSVFTLDIGNTTFAQYIDDEDVGSLRIDNLLLRPGNNTFPFTASVNQARIVDKLRSDKYCRDQIMPFELEGRTVENHGQPLPYFADALKSGRQTVQIHIGDIVERTLRTRITCESDD